MIKLVSPLLLLLFSCGACNQQVIRDGPPGYSLARPQILKMPRALNEISGIAFNAGRSDTLYAQQDEEGSLFYFATISKEVKHRKFGKKGDYEDIAICNGMVWILRSDGVLFSFPLDAPGDAPFTNVAATAGIIPRGEYEGLYADAGNGMLYVLCKACPADNAAKSITGYILQIVLGKGPVLKSTFQVNTKAIAEKLGGKKVAFKPSALAMNQRTGEWYLLSSVNRLLVVADAQWGIKEVYPLAPSLFAQPEGIAFDEDHNLYISNEFASPGNATVLKFVYTKDNQ